MSILGDIKHAAHKVQHGVEHTVHEAQHVAEHAVHQVSHAGHKVTGVVNDPIHAAKDLASDVIHELEKVGHKIEGGVKEVGSEVQRDLRKAGHEIEKTFTERLEDLASKGLHEFEEAAKKLGAELATYALQKGIALFLELLHDALPDKPQAIRVSAFKFVWESLDDRLDAMVEFVKHPPQGVDGLVAFAKAVQPDYVVVTPSADIAALVATTNVLGVQPEVVIPVEKLESAAVKVVKHFASMVA